MFLLGISPLAISLSSLWRSTQTVQRLGSLQTALEEKLRRTAGRRIMELQTERQTGLITRTNLQQWLSAGRIGRRKMELQDHGKPRRRQTGLCNSCVNCSTFILSRLICRKMELQDHG